MSFKMIQPVMISQIIGPFLTERTSLEVTRNLEKKFKKASKQVADLIAKEILSTYDIQCIHKVTAENVNPTITIHFLPKRKYWHKK